ncbi:hypothetical protein GGR54DRAFT_105320 [Hypoxylon sp. NC1633]|nr:hypothetical protein GGR54DRAFT_105320 [Hypoxylon sp. NC1633]
MLDRWWQTTTISCHAIPTTPLAHIMLLEPHMRCSQTGYHISLTGDGPSMTIDTACSSSLVAIHQAIQQLRTGQSRVAVAAGSNLIMDPGCFISLSSLNMLSPDGRSKMWDANANGYARGEGVAAVVLKTLSAALRDGDDIECTIRETGLSQDGKTQGITSPSHAAQTQLIRDCYSSAGLDITNPTHHPQFFECHGTGTLAGDAAEAEAIKTAFFPTDSDAPHGLVKDTTRLLVGSIKSIIGHTEGTAGIAGVLKAMLALKNATIPPNLLFHRLNPRIKPFYENLQVSTAASPWPHVQEGNPRRASVNSFGFGGANAHAILESYEPEQPQQDVSVSTIFSPFVFSAASKTSLLAYLSNFLEFLQANSHNIRLQDLGYTLHSRRTCFQVTLALTASTVDELCDKIRSTLEEARGDAGRVATRRVALRSSRRGKPSMLGVFTGQGAQWAGMGSQLLKTSKAARKTIERLELRLAQLPTSDRPAWSLTQVLLDDPPSSHSDIGKATLSQPLCTAIQILQVDLLRAAGIKFAAVVGHSSGEIAAAYASGFITAEDAICIAYYRGLHSHLASGSSGEAGAMMAVGTTPEDALDLLVQPEFKDHVSIAAVNSPINITLSGDQDSIAELKVIFEDEKKFTRILKVDKAYHSHHMTLCSGAYLESLRALEIQTGHGNGTTWFSSVFDGEDMSIRRELLQGSYWNDNMVNTVLFKQAVSRAYESQGDFDIAIEIGPHPALKGPVTQTVQDLSSESLPYTGVFSRGTSAVESLSGCLGFIWTRFGKDAVDLHSFDTFVSSSSRYRLVKGLPTYAWEHGDYWNESRYAKAVRLRPDPVHELLGHMAPDSNEQDLRWRHILQPSEMPWLMGHQLQGQIVFPAAAYVVTALEAALAMGNHKNASISLIELSEVEFYRALVFDDDKSSVEVIISLGDITHPEPDTIEANFKYHASDGKGDGKLSLFSVCRVRVLVGEYSPDLLPPRPSKPLNLIKVPADKFYSTSRDLDYQWTGAFMALDKLERKLGAATGCLNITEPSPMLIHPGLLDAVFQGVLLGYSYPDDGQLWTIHVPRKIKRLTINPSLCASQVLKGEPLPFQAYLDPDTIEMVGGSDIYPSDPTIDNAMIQIEEVECVPLSRTSAQDDKEVYAAILWDVAEPDLSTLAAAADTKTQEQQDLDQYTERLLGYYMRTVERQVAADHPARVDGPYSRLLHSVSTVISSAQKGCYQPCLRPEWKNDTYEQLNRDHEKFAQDADVQLLNLVGASVADVIDGVKPAVKVNDTLARQFYTDGLGLGIYNRYLGQVMKQITHRSPHLDILQLGSGAGAATQAILDGIGTTFSSYTFTDTSSRWFESAKEYVAPYLQKFIFKTLNINENPLAQGFSERSYDVVVAALVLHTTPSIEQTLQNIRRLLKPGGRLVVIEPLPTTYSVYDFVLEALPQWWHGPSLSQPLNVAGWDSLLRETGFSGCDTATPELVEHSRAPRFALFASQAVDDQVTFIRHPLGPTSSGMFEPGTLIQDLVIIGGNTSQTAKLVEGISTLVERHCGRVRICRTLPDVSQLTMTPKTTVLSLAQLETPVFQDLDSVGWESLKALLMTAGVLLWVTQGRRSASPFASMMVGLVRSAIREIPTLHYRMLDFEDAHDMSEQALAEALLRFQAEYTWLKEDSIHVSVENELVIESGGRATIPRLAMSDAMNSRYNSLRHPTTALCQPQAEELCLVPTNTDSGYEMRQGPIGGNRDGLSGVRISVTHSLLSAIRVTESCYMFLILGNDAASGVRRIGFSTANSSVTSFAEDLSVVTQVQSGSEAKLLSQVVCRLLALSLFSGLSPGDIVLAYEPQPVIAAVLADEARRCGVQVTFVTTKANMEPLPLDYEWTRIHKSASTSILRRLLPAKVSVFFYFGTAAEGISTRERILSLLPAACRREGLEKLFAAEAWLPTTGQVGLMHNKLREAVDRASDHLDKGDSMRTDLLPVILADSITGRDDKPAPYSLLDWESCPSIPIRVQPSADRITFSSQGTYWLAGLSRGLGLALCEWMIRRGARHFAITSRNPKIEPLWLDQMRKLGAVLKIASCDVTIKEQVVSVHREICNSMPPIIGVCQGSMVLEDTAIRDMTVENFLNGTRPKVEGSMHLDELFQENTLDFFVFFSSVVSTIGRPGQANYSAANMFMASLAKQRRRKGLAASVIHIGPIYGVGYAAQFDTMIYNRAVFRSTALVPTSELEFYQLFAEAVIAGRPDSGWETIELLNGVRRISPHENDRPVWEAEPLMSHFVRNVEELGAMSSDSQVDVPLKTKLAQATERSQLYGIVHDALLPKLYTLFQMDPKKIGAGDLVATRLDDLGIDSLLAAEIRGWFMKSLEVNIPALKILSGVPVHDLIVIASETIPDRLIPGLTMNETEDSTANPPIPSIPEDHAQDSRSDTSLTTNSWGPESEFSVSPTDTSSDVPSSVAGVQSSGFQKTFRLSFSQEMFWFIWVFLKDKTSLNHTAWARVTGRVNIPSMQKAVRTIGQYHETLRTAIIEKDGKPLQAIMDTSTLYLETRDIIDDEEVQRHVDLLQDHHVYDIARGQTTRLMLLTKSPEEHFLVAGLHPLIADGFSFQSLLKGLQQLYISPNFYEMHPPRAFSDYSERQHRDLTSGKLEGDLQFWKNEFTTISPPLPVLTLSTSTSRPDLVVYENVQAQFEVGPETKGRIQDLCRRYRTTPFHFYLAVFRVLLLRYAPIGDGEDVTIGIGDANRTGDEMMDVIGPFVNLLPLRLQVNASDKFADLLEYTRGKAYSALAHSRVPFQVLLNELEVSRSASYTSLFQCFVNYRQGMHKTTALGSGPGAIALDAVKIGIPKMAYDITLEMVDYMDGGCTQIMALRKDVYGQAEAERLIQSYERLLHAFLEEPSSLLHQPDLFSPEETQELMELSRGPSWESTWPDTVIHRIDEVTHVQPQKIAIQDGETTSSYEELSAHANAVAAALIEAGVAANAIVAVLMEPSSASIASLLGIMRVGAVYLPLDLSWPPARLSSVLQDCQPSVVLLDTNTEKHANSIELPAMTIINVSSIDKNVSRTPVFAHAHDPAALLYTSGSSGVPKGILLKHEGLRNWAELTPRAYNIGSEVVLQQTTPTFDLSLVQIFTALCHGGRLCLVPRQQRTDPRAISEIIMNQGVTFSCATPSEYTSWLRYGIMDSHKAISWKTAFCAGEPIPHALLEQITTSRMENLRLYNLYGPTEASLAATGMHVPLEIVGGPIAAGRPLPNYSVYVLDEQLRLVPIGVQGEIYLGGAGVGLGYVNQAKLSKARFVPNIFATPDDKDRGWTTMHRTGDFGRWRKDRALLIEGRIDTQIKLRGLRIDLSEIEQAIVDTADGAVREVIVSVRRLSSSAPESLVAYGVFGDTVDTDQKVSDIKTRLSARLPQYMCPAAILSLDTLPTTSSGKLDRRAVSCLPLPSEISSVVDLDEESLRAPLTGTETRLKDIWEHVLGFHNRITASTDFFHIGGSSLLLLKLRAVIDDKFNAKIPLVRMFESSTLRAMAHLIDEGAKHAMDAAPINWDEETSLSPELLSLEKKLFEGPREDKSQIVILTGSTGKLGRALLEALIADPKVKHVHCIGVRDIRNKHAVEALDKNKITLHEGDLISPRLGLSEDKAAELFGSADVVIHNGADMSYLKTYDTLRAVNLQSTKALIEMLGQYSTRGFAAFHYISTISVGNVVTTAILNGGDVQVNGQNAQTAEGFVFRPVSVAAHPPPPVVSSSDIIKTGYGYIATKWASEAFLERVHDKFPDWPIVIHRPSLIAGSRSWDMGDTESPPGLEFVENIRRYAALIRAVPAIPVGGDEHASVGGAFNVVSLDEVAKGVMGAITANGDAREQGVRFLHHLGGLDLPLSNLQSWVKDAELGDGFAKMDVVQWARKAAELGMHPAMVALFEDLAAADGRLVFPRLEK